MRVIFLDSNFTPVAPTHATMAKVLHANGGVEFVSAHAARELLARKARQFNEFDHERGKTTRASRGGSFAPKAHDRRSVSQIRHDEFEFATEGDTVLRPRIAARAQGKLGEIAMHNWLVKQGYRVERPSAQDDWSPIDLIAEKDGEYLLVEVKTADAAKSDKRWRANVGGAAWQERVRKADLSPAERKTLFARMTQEIIDRKHDYMQAHFTARGLKARPVTLGVTIDYPADTMSVYWFEDWFAARSFSHSKPKTTLGYTRAQVRRAVEESGMVEINRATGEWHERAPRAVSKSKGSALAQTLWHEFVSDLNKRFAVLDAWTKQYLDTASHADSGNASTYLFDVDTDPLLDDRYDIDSYANDATLASKGKRTMRNINELGDALARLAERYRNGNLTRKGLQLEFEQSLRARFEKAMWGIPVAEKRKWVQELVAAQMKYLDGFIAAMDNSDSLYQNNEAVARRARLYALSLRAARGLAQLLRAEYGTKLKYVMSDDPRVEHCADCIHWNGKTKTASQWRKMNVYPGSSRNECGQFCKCHWEVVSTAAKFSRHPRYAGMA